MAFEVSLSPRAIADAENAYLAEIEGSCNEVQPVAETHAVQLIQRFYFQSLAIAQI